MWATEEWFQYRKVCKSRPINTDYELTLYTGTDHFKVDGM